MAYTPDISRITAMDQVLKEYRNDFDAIKAAEMHYERMRTLSKTSLIQVNITKSIGNIVGALSIDSIWNSPLDSAIESALAEARSSILARAVGPLEGLPVSDYLQDSIRAKNVATHTQVGAEHRLIAKLSQMKGNSWNTINEYGGISTVLTSKNVVDTRALKENLYATDKGRTNIAASIVGPTIGPTGNIGNKWHDEKYGVPYSESQAVEIAKNTFNFSIINKASGKRVWFPAHISNFNEGVSTSWGNVSLINRSEDIYIYQRAERSFNLEFVLFASTNDDLVETDGPFPTKITISKGTVDEEVGLMSKKMMWDRINFLHQLTRPSYTTDGMYDKAPYCKLYVGGLLNGITAIFDSININYDPMIWDFNVDKNDIGVRPMIAQITTSGKFIHNTVPSVISQFYGDQ